MGIRIDSVNKSLGRGDGKTDALRDASCTIDESEICMIVGMDSPGKSTLLSCLGGLDRPDSSTILVGDQEITSLSREDPDRYRRDFVGLAFQLYNLIPILAVRENTGVCKYLSDDPMPLDDLLADLGLASRRDKLPSRFSGGQQQRHAITRAPIKRPRLLLCGKPTRAPNYETSKEMLPFLKCTDHDLGMTIITITYDQMFTEVAHRTTTVRDDRISDVEVWEDPALASSLIW